MFQFCGARGSLVLVHTLGIWNLDSEKKHAIEILPEKFCSTESAINDSVRNPTPIQHVPGRSCDDFYLNTCGRDVCMKSCEQQAIVYMCTMNSEECE